MSEPDDIDGIQFPDIIDKIFSKFDEILSENGVTATDSDKKQFLIELFSEIFPKSEFKFEMLNIFNAVFSGSTDVLPFIGHFDSLCDLDQASLTKISQLIYIP